jgi:GAF domain-containing protein
MADELTLLRETVARQAAEIEHLRGQFADEGFVGRFREVFSLATTAGTIVAPIAYSRLLEMVLETATYVISARAGSIFLIDPVTNELVVEHALGPKADEAKSLRVPIGHGIAGLVAVSGQPMAVSDARRDPRQASDIAERLGYLPSSILCVPLVHDDHVIGVIELLDRIGAPSFSGNDLQALGLFAGQAAVAIEQSRSLQSLAALIGEVLQLLPEGTDPRVEQLRADARAFARRLEDEPTYRRALDLARLVQEVSRAGEAETTACTVILRGFAEYLRSRPMSLADIGPSL